MVAFRLRGRAVPETCPKCGHAEVETDTCPRCRVIVSKYNFYLESGIYQQSLGKAPPKRAPAWSGPARGQATRSVAPSPSVAPATTERVPPPSEPTVIKIRRLSFHGTGGSLFGIQIVNILLTLVTLGIYNFWGKVKVRRYLLSQTEFDGDRFAYHGTGKELLTGYLKAILVFGVVFGLAGLLAVLNPLFLLVSPILAYAISLVITAIATVGARRYRLSRTSWRGIRFSFRARTGDFIKLFFAGSLLSTITLGLYYPIFATRRYDFLTSRSYFGNQKFYFDGRGKDLFGRYVLTLLLTIPTLGLCWFWFLARKRNYFWDHTSIATASFHSAVTGKDLFLLYLVNLLLLVITGGLAWPWVKVRSIRFTFTYLTLEGPMELAGILQEAQVAPATGEGLAGLLDTDVDLG